MTTTKELTNIQPETFEKLVLHGNLSSLTPQEKVIYYNGYCQRLGLDPFTQPFKILKLNGREVLYCDRSGTQQLSKLHNVSHDVKSRELIKEVDVYQVTARASLPDGRFTDSIGAVTIAGLKGDAYANAIMKAETKAKRRATLDLLGLGILDETEIDTIPNANVINIEPAQDFIMNPIERIKDCKTEEELKELYKSMPEIQQRAEHILEATKNKKQQLKSK